MWFITRLFLFMLLWCILFVLCWPLAVLVLVMLPVVWLVLLPFRVAYFVIEALVALVRAILMLPARVLTAARLAKSAA